MKQHEKVKKIAVTGLLSALVFLFSWVQIPIGDVARLHLGNVFCALSGLLFGPLVGGIASGFGSMLFDFTNPAYTAESWITFITKFAIGFLAGVIAKRSAAGRAGVLRDTAAAGVGCFAYVVLYLLKSFIMMAWVERQVMEAVYTQLITKGITSAVNALCAVVFSVVLAQAMRPALRRAHLWQESTLP